MNSIKTKISLITAAAIIVSMTLAALIGISSVRKLNRSSSEQILYLLCETGEKNLDYYLGSIEQSVAMVSSFAEADLERSDTGSLDEHVDRVNALFRKIADETNGVLTYYYRIDPEVSRNVKGFWYVDVDGKGFTEHEVTDITEYDTMDTSKLTWFTVPKATGNSVWLPPYITDNLDVRVLSYNVPIYRGDEFIGVVGIEHDYSTMANQVDNIKLYDNGYAFINDSEGNLIYHPRIDVSTTPDEELPKVPDGLLSDMSVVNYTFEGVEKQAVRLDLSNGMRLNVAVPVSEINGEHRSLIIQIVIVSVLLLVLSIAVTTRFAGRITKPLRELSKAAEQMNKGNYDVELDCFGNDEVGVLSHTFNQLTSNLKAYISELNELNDELKADNLTLEAATVRDSLTGVKNRFALRRDYDKYSEQDIHIMMLDIDDFKGVNDGYGHSVGDYLLKRTGDALLELFGAEYSYRYGGDEFMVIIPDVKEEQFADTIKRLGERLEELRLEDRNLPVHFSAGYVYGSTVLQDDLRLMLRQADELLYKAKGSGKSTFIGASYDREHAANIKKRAEEAFRQS